MLVDSAAGGGHYGLMNDILKIGGLFVLGFVAGALVMNVISNRLVADDSDATSEEVKYNTNSENGDTAGVPVTAGSVSVKIDDQDAGDAVFVKSVTIPENGWIVIHEVVDGHVSNALGAARFDAGAHTNASVPLLRSTIAGGTYVVVLYADNGNRTFELNADLPLVDESGNALIQEFAAL